MNGAKEVRTNNLKIEKNVIVFEDTVLQISNISLVGIEEEPKERLNSIFIVLLCVGILAMFWQMEMVQTVGLILTLIAGMYFIWLCVTNSSKQKYLHINMNSGRLYCLFCKDEVFLSHVLSVIEYCFNNQYAEEIHIDLTDCILYNSPILFGDNNEVM